MDSSTRIKLPGDKMWEALACDPGIGCTILDGEGTIHCINATAAELFLQMRPEAVRGKKLSDVLPDRWTRERLEVFDQILVTKKPVILRYIRHGRQLQTTFRLLDRDDHGKPRFIAVTTAGEQDPISCPENFEIRESGHTDLGRLDVLTRRELEVLALIKQGMTLDQIARSLHRSPKTIEKHRHSIGKKLKESSRVKLAQLAERAGLVMHDAELMRARVQVA